MNDGPTFGNGGDESRGKHLRAMIVAAQSATANARSRGHNRARSMAATGPPTYSIAGHELLGELHRGGQGVVYRAIQESTKRMVAIKVMKEGPFAGPADRARFEREIRILGALLDPRIVAIHGSGIAAGSHYFVMDFIEGRPLDLAFAGRTATLAEIVGLFVEICEAVNTAHLLGIVHRDLKPGNILIDESGAPHVLDFGLAKSISGGVRENSVSYMTRTGQFVGSLPWAAPEQVRAEGLITPQTDVYSLGILLFQTLTTRFPYPIVGELDQVLRNIHYTEPVRPRTIRRDIDDELETIVMKCLAKEPERRYASAGALGRDLENYLRGEPIDAKRASGWYILRKTLRRYRTTLAVAAIFMLLVTASAIWLRVLYGRQGVLLIDISRERDRARQSESAEKQGRHRAEYEGYMANIAAADAALASDDGGAALRRLSEAPQALRNWEWRFLNRAADPSVVTIHGPQNRELKHMGFSPSGRFLAGMAYRPAVPSELLVWDRLASTPVLRVTIGDDTTVPYFVSPYLFANSDSRLRVCPGDGNVIEYDLESGKEVSRIPIVNAQPMASTWMATWNVYVGYRVVDSLMTFKFFDDHESSMQGQFRIDANPWITAAANSSTGRQFAIAQVNGMVHLCPIVPSAEPVGFRAHDTQIYGIAFSPSGNLLATSAEDGLIKLWAVSHDDSPINEDSSLPVNKVRETRSFRGSTQRVFSVAFSPDGSKLAAATAEKTMSVWSVKDGALLRIFRGHVGMVSSVAFHPDGRHIVTGSYDETVKLWDLNLPPETTIRRELPGIVNGVKFDSDGTRLMVGTTSGALVLDPKTCATMIDVRDKPEIGFTIFDSKNLRAIIGRHDGTVRVVELDTGRETNRFEVVSPDTNLRLALNPAGTQLACADSRIRKISIRDLNKGAEFLSLEHLVGTGLSMTYSPDGAKLATGSKAGELILWDISDGRQIWYSKKHAFGVMSIAFSPDGRRIATASEDSTIKLWDADSGLVRMTLRPQLGDVWCVAFSPDGTRLAAGGRDRSVRIFDAETGYEILSLRGPTGTVLSVAFSSDGRRIAAGSWAREVFIWDADIE